MKSVKLLLTTIAFCSLFGCEFGITSCSSRNSEKTSTLVIAVEGLSVDSIDCFDNEKSENSGYSVFCQEAIRFTHAFSTSPQAIPALTSILTGLYPFESGVRDNSGRSPNPTVDFVAQAALKAGLKTAAFSGAPPVLRRGSLQKGFEVFDDQLNFNRVVTYRPIKESFTRYLNWLEENSKPSHFALIHSADLNQIDVVTTSKTGDLRPPGLESQKIELDEALAELSLKLKKMGLWNKMNIYLVGLHGKASLPREREIEALNLHSEMMQVALFIKPHGENIKTLFNKKIDKNISITDLGETLFHQLGHSKNPNESLKNAGLNRTNLGPILTEQNLQLSNDRLLVSETGWSRWRLNENYRYSLRKGDYFFIWDLNPRIYNSLTDRLEMSPLPLSDSSLGALKAEFFSFAEAQTWPRFRQPYLSEIKKWSLKFPQAEAPPSRWVEFNRSLGELETLLPEDSQVASWSAYNFLQTQNWFGLKRLGKKFANNDWIYISELNLQLPITVEPSPCLKLLSLEHASNETIRICEDGPLSELARWKYSSNSEIEESKRRFLNSYLNLHLDTQRGLVNLNRMLVVDTSVQSLIIPNSIDLAFAIPNMSKFAIQAKKFLSGVNQNLENSVTFE
jgi:hypothetical protein